MKDRFLRSMKTGFERLFKRGRSQQEPKPGRTVVTGSESDREYELAFWRAAASAWY